MAGAAISSPPRRPDTLTYTTVGPAVPISPYAHFQNAAMNKSPYPQSPRLYPDQPAYDQNEKKTQRDTRSPSPSTDEGYDSEERSDEEKYDYEEKPGDRKEHPTRDYEIPIVKSTRTIRVSYTPFTYFLTLLIVSLHLHLLLTHPSIYLFPNVYTIFNLLFHLSHLFAHTLHHTSFERLCVVYGTSVLWIGWTLGVSVFCHSVPIDLTHPTTTLFWFLMLERRSAWGIIMWEHMTHLEEEDGFDLESSQWSNGGASLASWFNRVMAYRVWSLAGVGAMWSLLYLFVARLDGRQFVDMLRFVPIFKIHLFTLLAGMVLVWWWSFWTFQYRGVVWRKELKEGIVVWYSEGYVRAGEIQ
ncbi:hypothetical protein BC938DRAFT_470705 [Jimgerdemannia flammicorona]|uniref:Uncharacterized protein n=1 Tax=Jimgerdemannia flammicorona TaxID=994334 RepID=A0A433Q9M4_9FUNG|nr:hypothetical protein BC938DRAFT_470705 [Jimgerdemannia flammicorona]